MKTTLVLFGGSGFVGQGIIKNALTNQQPIISISRTGNQSVDPAIKEHPLIRWVACDILTSESWQQYLTDRQFVINLIGILHPTSANSYQQLIIDTNQRIIQALKKYPNSHYLFLSASGGSPPLPKNYLLAKKTAEQAVLQLPQSTTILRPGLIVDKRKPLSCFLGCCLKIGATLPFIKKWLQPVAPIELEKLAEKINQQVVLFQAKQKTLST